jgi:PAS domain S-box-containing protein
VARADRGQEAKLLLEMGRIARDNPGRDDSLSRVAELVLENFPADAVSILLYDPSSRSAYVPVSVSRADDVSLVPADITLRVSAGSSLEQALRNPDKPLFVPEGSEDPVLGTAGNLPVAVIPMASGDQVAGFLLLSGKDRDSLLKTDLDLLMSVAAQAALLANAYSLEDRLDQSEERYRMLTENAAGLAFVLDQGGRFLYVNQRSRDVLGYEPGELVGRYFGEFVTPESWARTTAAIKKAAAARESYVEYEWVAQRKDGKEVTLGVEASLVYQGVELRRHQGIARDASMEMMLKEELQKTGQELSQTKSREERMRDYLTVANLAQEEERARIAREIHDGAVQYLVAMRRRLDLFKKEYSRKAASPGRDPGIALSDLDSLLDTAVSDLREFARNLRPPVLDDFGLVSACEWLAGQTEKEGVRVVFSTTGELRRLSRDVEVSAFRIVQEALANVVKHSGASTVELRLDFATDRVAIAVSDNGKGFELQSPPGSLGRAGQMGLVGISERAELMGATMDLRSEPGRGTFLSVVIPLPKQ